MTKWVDQRHNLTLTTSPWLAGPCFPVRFPRDLQRGVRLRFGAARQPRWGRSIPVLTDPELVALLGGPTLPCSLVTDFVESMEVVLADGARRNNVTTCEDPPIEAALATIRQLSETYLPED